MKRGHVMGEEAKAARRAAIEAAALTVLEARGYAETSMLAVARAAKASNETLYNWYGDKAGLFRAMVTANIEDLRSCLEAKADDASRSIEMSLASFGPQLLAVLTSDRVVALNRAAAADSSGELGQIIASAGRQGIAPLIAKAFADADKRGKLCVPDPQEAAEIYLGLLLGDLQIRRVVGRMSALDPAEIERRAARALRISLWLWSPKG